MRGYIQFSSDGEPLYHHRAGWKTKYEFNRQEGRDLDTISSPLSCEWLRRYWTMKYPGVMIRDRLQMIDTDVCSYSVQMFHSAVKQCGSNFTGKPDERVPLFSINNSEIECVHKAITTACNLAFDAREEYKNILFSTT